jgi:membrane-bound metal-dependent hydrolase YbcI (DUF457 family)
MDIVHHAAIGGAGFAAASSVGHEAAGAAFLVGSALPDLDVAFMAFGRRAYLRLHQGPSHSLFLLPLFAGLVALALSPFSVPVRTVFFGLFLGMLVHVLLDLINTYGISILWPLRRSRYSLDAVFFIDAISWAMTGAFFVSLLFVDPRYSFPAYVAAFAAYVLFRQRLRKKVMKALGCTYAVGSALDPFVFYVLEDTEDGVGTYEYNARTGEKTNPVVYERPSAEHLALAERSPVFKDMQRIFRHYHITSVSEDAEGTTIEARDLGVRNFGGRFGRAVLRFDPEGRLINEAADI